MLNFKQTQNNSDDIKVKEYIDKYIKELQRHFDVSDRRMRLILIKVYQELMPQKFIKTFVYKLKSMVESLYNKQNKGG